MSIFLKNEFKTFLFYRLTSNVSSIYLQKYLKPYKTPLRVAFLYLSFLFFDFFVYLQTNFKPIVEANLQIQKLMHDNFLDELLIN